MKLHEDKFAFLNIINLIHEASSIRADILEKDYYVTLLILHHFPNPRTRPFCRPSSWMEHYTIRLSQVERLWRGLSGIWKLTCFLI